MRWSEVEKLLETSSAGGTCSGNVATVPGNNGKSGNGAIGAGFDPGGDWGVYNSAKKKPMSTKSKNKPNIIKR
jgi:hypothetical protein